MEKIISFTKPLIRSQKYKVLPLPSWSLASARFVIDGEHYYGTGFDPKKASAENKAISEAMERYAYYTWKKTKHSPFTGAMQTAPPPTSGFAAHFDREISRQNAFLEFCERHALSLISANQLKMTECPKVSLGPFFDVGLLFSKCQLRLWVTEGPIFVCTAVGSLNKEGVIFGSSASYKKTSAIQHATGECLRKLAFIESWKNNCDLGDPFFVATKFWLSPAGYKQGLSFFNRAELSSKKHFDVKFLNSRHSECKFNGLWISHYFDENFQLPELYDLSIPLI